ncbi:HAD family hydrolase [uncultured Eubacterium sp.]|uniref:HAD family hydrolase n=1 Tax=uncultured Eubacterium sp. TaxID=165185 RepID=UPI0025D05A47|nr:HAD-IIB family hydrolase [uncultured Eubacterium sp.]MCI6537160.1 HAD-IIB family hydrolase [Lachnospiraceae bacterium]
MQQGIPFSLISAPHLLEITAGGINKAQALTHFCKLKQIAPEHALAFGDNYNDVEMLETAGCGVLMGNAPADLKRKGFPITADNDHDGIAVFLNQLSLI